MGEWGILDVGEYKESEAGDFGFLFYLSKVGRLVQWRII